MFESLKRDVRMLWRGLALGETPPYLVTRRESSKARAAERRRIAPRPLRVAAVERAVDESAQKVRAQQSDGGGVFPTEGKNSLVMQRSDIIARTIITRTTNPLLAEFLENLPDDQRDQAQAFLEGMIDGPDRDMIIRLIGR